MRGFLGLSVGISLVEVFSCWRFLLLTPYLVVRYYVTKMPFVFSLLLCFVGMESFFILVLFLCIIERSLLGEWDIFSTSFLVFMESWRFSMCSCLRLNYVFPYFFECIAFSSLEITIGKFWWLLRDPYRCLLKEVLSLLVLFTFLKGFLGKPLASFWVSFVFGFNSHYFLYNLVTQHKVAESPKEIS